MLEKRSRMQVLAADAPSGSGELLIMNDLPVYKRGRNKIQEAIEEAEQKKRKNKIKNRISAAKSRARSQEHTRFLEEKVEQLRNENALLKKLLSLVRDLMFLLGKWQETEKIYNIFLICYVLLIDFWPFSSYMWIRKQQQLRDS
ncbi:uncharacterized protein [Gossypium hirsutum]|uniref:Uncharacterized protein isoform X1 n=1 Tax=Gossypium hirsutum TaxID=3635 RepID=A0A1U8KNJ5_GOSHI|nr:uncharacterized protein LOC107917775 isoform X1 [Gossypium hirsutum]